MATGGFRGLSPEANEGPLTRGRHITQLNNAKQHFKQTPDTKAGAIRGFLGV